MNTKNHQPVLSANGTQKIHNSINFCRVYPFCKRQIDFESLSRWTWGDKRNTIVCKSHWIQRAQMNHEPVERIKRKTWRICMFCGIWQNEKQKITCENSFVWHLFMANELSLSFCFNITRFAWPIPQCKQ